MVWTSPYEPIALDGATLPELIRGAAARSPGRPALVDGATGLTVSYATLAERIDRLAASLAARGLGPGDVLALWAPNIPPWAGVALAAMAAGAAVTGIGPAASERELAAQLADAGASVLVTVPRLAETARAAATGVREVVVIGDAPGATPIARLLAGGAQAPARALDPGSLALLPCSSGTTGLPKLVMLTHANLAAAVAQLGRGLTLDEHDRVLALAPFAHVMGFVVSLACPLVAGATVVTLPRFELPALLAAIERHRVTVLPVPPPIMVALARHPQVERHDLSSLELIISGGAPLSAELQQAVAARFPHAAVGQGYGMTETSAPIPVPDRRRGTAPGSVGRLAPNTKLRVVDPTSGRDLGRGERGELWVRGPQNTPGYLGRPDATAQLIDRDGWLHTGDLGWVDADGNLYVTDRLKALIKVNAFQVAPAELEALLLTHPHVADAAVIARPDERTGQIPVAIVVPRGPLDPDELMGWIAARVAPHKRVRAVRLVDQIPRTPAGKILRRLLVDQDRPPTPAPAQQALA